MSSQLEAAAMFCCISLAIGCSSPSGEASSSPPAKRGEQFDALLKRHASLTDDELIARAAPRAALERLSFDPAEAAFFATVAERLQLTVEEQERLRQTGLVSIDHDQRYSFGSMYFAIYSQDLPVLITSDSILHAMHRSYDGLLQELEYSLFTTALEDVLRKAHERLGEASPSDELAVNHADVDLYLTVARNLLEGAGAPAGTEESQTPFFRRRDVWNGALVVHSRCGQDESALELLQLIQAGRLQHIEQNEFTEIYGGRRPIDYSQFAPRGRYTQSFLMARYFRTMMWLGRADTGWNVLPVDPQSRLRIDSSRELRNSVLLTQLLESSGGNVRLEQLDAILDFLVGESDNLTPAQVAYLLERRGIADLNALASEAEVRQLQSALRTGEFGKQQIQSQALASDPGEREKVETPSLFQMFGQRFVIDSFVLSKVVFDEIVIDGVKKERMMPTGLDVAYALGNDAAAPLLAETLRTWEYAPNLAASREFVDQQTNDFWKANLYNAWLDALRQLDDEPAAGGEFPQVMRTAAWQRKQLQTQLASWSELRHDTLLYAKQSYTSVTMCEYPAGYVEPYPELYARVKFFATEGARLLEAADYSGPEAGAPKLAEMKSDQVGFLKQMAVTLGRLELLARKELAAEPFTAEESTWLKKVIDAQGFGSGPPKYDGWYCDLFYGGGIKADQWNPTVVDVHTDPNSGSALHVGVGDCNFLVAAIDNADDRMIYVGPAYSYYEFPHPVEKRLADPEWQQRLVGEERPLRPEWVNEFQMPAVKRELQRVAH